jgi:hypothetical protein
MGLDTKWITIRTRSISGMSVYHPRAEDLGDAIMRYQIERWRGGHVQVLEYAEQSNPYDIHSDIIRFKEPVLDMLSMGDQI